MKRSGQRNVSAACSECQLSRALLPCLVTGSMCWMVPVRCLWWSDWSRLGCSVSTRTFTALEGRPDLQTTSDFVKVLRFFRFYCCVNYKLPDGDVDRGIGKTQLNSSKTFQDSPEYTPHHPSFWLSTYIHCFVLFIFGIRCAVETPGLGKDGSIL